MALNPIRMPHKYPAKRHFKGPNAGKLSGNPQGKNLSDVHDEGVSISWKVVATLDISSAVDMLAESEICVLKPLELPDWFRTPISDDSAEVSNVKKSGVCSMILSLHSSDFSSTDVVYGSNDVVVFRSNDVVEGVVSVAALKGKDVTAHGVVVELIRREKFGDLKGYISVDKFNFRGDLTLSSEQRAQVPFQLNVGQVEVPSLKLEHSSVVWLVKSTLDVWMCADPSVSQEINVWF